MSSLTIDRISKRFQKVTALSRVDLQVEDGEFCVLLGPSGCGKSTLLQIIAGLLPQDDGSVLFDGASVDRLSPRERDVAMVFQNYALYPHMTVAENLGFGLRMRGLPKSAIAEQVKETAGLLDIGHLLQRKPAQLSGGQRQRVAMGRALVRRPKLFLLDEPLSNLDAQLRVNVRLELKKLHRQMHTTIVYVTHDQVEAMTLGDKVVVMKDGRVHQIGRPEVIYERPADTFVATFIGSPVMNLFRGTLTTSAEKWLFRTEDFSLDLDPLSIDSVEGELLLGIRPEDIGIAQEIGGSRPAVVDMISNVGSDKFVHARIGETSLTVRAPKSLSFERGETVSLVFDRRRLHLFREEKRIGPDASF